MGVVAYDPARHGEQFEPGTRVHHWNTRRNATVVAARPWSDGTIEYTVQPDSNLDPGWDGPVEQTNWSSAAVELGEAPKRGRVR